MSKPLVLIVGGEARTQAEIGRALKEIAMVSAIAAEPGLNLQEQLGTNPSAVIAAVGYAFGASFPIVSELASSGNRVIVVSPNKDPDLILQAMRAGAREFVMETDHDGIRRA